jgi:dTDP-4-amino-4,6-dideoxy-D-galactose acyltransferase
MTSVECCEYLSWDSEFFGCRIARLTASSLTDESMTEVLRWCEAQQIDCLYFLARSADVRSTKILEQNGFYFVDLRLTLQKQTPALLPEMNCLPQIRVSRDSDVPELRAIAKISHHDSRFYSDPHFNNARCDLLYEEWIERSCEGYADRVLVADFNNGPVGYITCHVNEAGLGRIGLLAVSRDAQGKGIGQCLITAATEWLVSQGVQRIRVVTQGKNVRAQRTYQRCGFLSFSMELWFHRWFSRKNQ